MTAQCQTKIRVGAVSYLNTKPLVQGLAEAAPWIELVYDLPSRLADDLAAGKLDVALIPSIEAAQDASYSIISDACIACRGPVWSVKLFSRVPPAKIRTLALDAGSRTSAALVQILLEQRTGVRPKLEVLPIGETTTDTSADAVLLIGDRAIHPPAERFAEVWDLGDEWCRWSDLPFVFAMWTAREGIEVGPLAAELSAARDRGLANLDVIAKQEAAPMGLTTGECLRYLRDNLYFYLGANEQRGLELYVREAQRLGLLPAGCELKFAVEV